MAKRKIIKIINTDSKDSTKLLDAALGAGIREAALEQNSHGFVAVTKVHKSKKSYSRKSLKSKIIIENENDSEQ